ncbi:unnamed protein product [Lactuca saligna]|uniref:Uncharacterized protein n=1 Tax=Lactuca saligna TaxID=75948 RepID=A0AA36EE91_LACSI|nr:unnamed protein product [Lactuca saligna]
MEVLVLVVVVLQLPPYHFTIIPPPASERALASYLYSTIKLLLRLWRNNGFDNRDGGEVVFVSDKTGGSSSYPPTHLSSPPPSLTYAPPVRVQEVSMICFLALEAAVIHLVAGQAVERATREARERETYEARDREAAEARLKSERPVVQRAQVEARERAAVDANGRAERAAGARQRYGVIPLSPNSGLNEWFPNCDTLHKLIREYNAAKRRN